MVYLLEKTQETNFQKNSLKVPVFFNKRYNLKICTDMYVYMSVFTYTGKYWVETTSLSTFRRLLFVINFVTSLQ